MAGHFDAFNFSSSDSLDNQLQFNESTPGLSLESSNLKRKSRKVSDEIKISINDSNFSEDLKQQNRNQRILSFQDSIFSQDQEIECAQKNIPEDSKDQLEMKKRDAKSFAKQSLIKTEEQSSVVN